MKPLPQHEEELQNRIQLGDATDHSPDAEAYRQVFAALRQETNFVLPVSFADRMVERLLREAERRENSRDRWWLIIGSTLLLLGFVFAFVYLEFKPSVGIFTFLAGYPGLIAFGSVFILVLHILDRKFIRTTSESA